MMRLLAIAACDSVAAPATAGARRHRRRQRTSGAGRRHALCARRRRTLPTKPKPLLKEAAIDLYHGRRVLLFVEQNARTPAPAAVARGDRCRAFFVTVQSYLLAIYVRQLGVAINEAECGSERRSLSHAGVSRGRPSRLCSYWPPPPVSPLVNSCLTAVVALPVGGIGSTSPIRPAPRPAVLGRLRGRPRNSRGIPHEPPGDRLIGSRGAPKNHYVIL